MTDEQKSSIRHYAIAYARLHFMFTCFKNAKKEELVMWSDVDEASQNLFQSVKDAINDEVNDVLQDIVNQLTYFPSDNSEVKSALSEIANYVMIAHRRA